MKNNIYNLINDGQFDNENYDGEMLNYIEKKKYKNNIRKHISKKNIKWIRKSRGIAAALIVMSFGVGFVRTDVGAQIMLDVSENIGSALRVDKNIDDYTTVVNKCVSDNGVNIQLNEVILAKNKLIISTEINSDKLLKDDEMYGAEKTIYINNKKVKFTGETGGTSRVDDYTSQSVMEYDLDSVNEADLEGELDVKIIYTKVYLMDHTNPVRGKWKFEFKTNGDALKRNTYEKNINYEFELENGEEITLERYTSNALSQNIYAGVKESKSKEAYDVMLKGKDNLGNEIEFYLSTKRRGYMDFEYDNHDKNIDENAKTLILTPYAVKMPEHSGKMPGRDEYVKVGDEFTIDISK